MKQIIVRVPASSANLGPAFDCLALALDLWNETKFTFGGDQYSAQISGEGAGNLPEDAANLVLRAFQQAYDELGEAAPAGIHIECSNRIPLGSGLGSSAAASLSGLLAANAALGDCLDKTQLLRIGAEMEGHADNLAAALHGGLVLVTHNGAQYGARQLPLQPLSAVFVLPEIDISTQAARDALPKQVPLADAVGNIGRALLLADAFRLGELEMLSAAMTDELHQPCRLPLLPGAAEALEAARAAGAAACLSGAGPGLIAFVEAGREKALTEVLRAPFAEHGINTRQFLLRSTDQPAKVTIN